MLALNVGNQGSHKNSNSHIDASHSRQPLVKGERLVRYEVNAVMTLCGMPPDAGSPAPSEHHLSMVAFWPIGMCEVGLPVRFCVSFGVQASLLGVSNLLLPRQGLGDGVQQSLLSPAGHVDGSPHSSR